MFKANHAAVWKRVDACWIQVDADRLVPGDVVRLYAGMLCPVDVTLAKGDQVLVSESSLTGEERSDRQAGKGRPSRGNDPLSTARRRQPVLKPAIADEQPVLRRRARMGTQFGAGAKSILRRPGKMHAHRTAVCHYDSRLCAGRLGAGTAVCPGHGRGLASEMLPVVTSVCLSGSAHRLKNKQVIVKNVDAMESLGSMDVVCVDKTGTLTEDAAVLEYYTDILGNESEQTLNLAYLESTSQGAAANQLNRPLPMRARHPSCTLPRKTLATPLHCMPLTPSTTSPRLRVSSSTPRPGRLVVWGYRFAPAII